MMELIDLLTLMGVLMAGFACLLAIVIVLQFLRRALQGVPHIVKNSIPTLPKIKSTPKKEETKMARTKKDGLQKEETTFNDVFMFLIAVPLVLLWTLFAGYVIWTGLKQPEVLADIESYTTLIAILGGPALLIIKDALDVWKTEQATKSSFYQTKAQAVIDMNVAHQKQIHDQETKHHEQMHLIEQNEQAHHHGVKPKLSTRKK